MLYLFKTWGRFLIHFSMIFYREKESKKSDKQISTKARDLEKIRQEKYGKRNCKEKWAVQSFFNLEKENHQQLSLMICKPAFSNKVFSNKPWPWVSKCSSIANYVAITSQYITSRAYLYFSRNGRFKKKKPSEAWKFRNTSFAFSIASVC